MDGKAKILIVDDEPDIIEFIAYNLKKEGYEVESASNGKTALEVAPKFQPDLIILDIMMPEMDGVEVCKRLRQQPMFKDTLIAFLTARNEDYTQITALEIGGDDYITKPIKPGVLISRIKALFRRSRKGGNSESERIIHAGDLKIDRDRILVIRGDEEIELAKKEFELLALLASKPGKVFQRNEILNKVWGRDVIVGNRTIDVHVRKLREKIGSHYIKTVKGIGYKFDF
jgi:two-component system alkaline phosphatase synthesis response regulator PhoP